MKQKRQEPALFEAKPDQPEDDIPDRPLSPLEAAVFIESMAADLRLMAKTSKLNTLAYFLEMVRVEASGEVVRLSRSDSRQGTAGQG